MLFQINEHGSLATPIVDNKLDPRNMRGGRFCVHATSIA